MPDSQRTGGWNLFRVQRFGKLKADPGAIGQRTSVRCPAQALPVKTMSEKRKAVVDRIESLEQAIRKAREYLESGKHADFHEFRPLFDRKKELPPHKDWVKNVFLPRREKSLARAEKILERLAEQERVRVRENRALQRTGRAEQYG
jgi:hypothetical protein